MSRSQRDLERDAAIVEVFHSGETASEIARAVGLTRERVRQILVRAGSETRHARTPESYARFCEHCGAKFYSVNWSRQRFCSIVCANRGKGKRGRPLDPNAKCRRICLVCEQPFTIRGGGYRRAAANTARGAVTVSRSGGHRSRAECH